MSTVHNAKEVFLVIGAKALPLPPPTSTLSLPASVVNNTQQLRRWCAPKCSSSRKSVGTGASARCRRCTLQQCAQPSTVRILCVHSLRKFVRFLCEHEADKRAPYLRNSIQLQRTPTFASEICCTTTTNMSHYVCVQIRPHLHRSAYAIAAPRVGAGGTSFRKPEMKHLHMPAQTCGRYARAITTTTTTNTVSCSYYTVAPYLHLQTAI